MSKRPKPSPRSAGAGGSGGAGALKLPEGWRNFILPPFTEGSRLYGAAATAGSTGSASTADAGDAADGWLAATGGVDADPRVVSDDSYEVLLATLAGPPDPNFDLTVLNPILYRILTLLTLNTYYLSQPQAKRDDMQQRVRFAFELIIGWIVRLWNVKCWVLPIVVLSLFFLRHNASRSIWAAGSRFRFLYDIKTAKLIATDLGRKVQMPGYFTGSKKVVLCVFDNLLVRFNRSYEGCRSRDDGDGSWAYLFITWLLRPIPDSLIPAEFDPAEGNTPCRARRTVPCWPRIKT